MFADASANDGCDYPDISSLSQKWQALHAEIEEHLPNVSDEQLTAQIKNEESPHNEKAVLGCTDFSHVAGILSPWRFRRNQKTIRVGCNC